MKKTLKNHDVFHLSAHSRIQLLVAAGAEAWVEESRKRASTSRKLKIRLKPGAILHWMTCSPSQDTKTFDLDAGARLEYYHHVLGTSEDITTINLNGDESSVISQTLFFGGKTQNQTLRVNHVHRGKNTNSKMISRGAVKDESSCHFFGNIEMAPGCSGANGTLEEHNLLLSKNAKIEAVPALEIHHDEVQASHSAALERVDDEKLFYLQSRGLNAHEGLELLVEGFFWDSLQKCPNLAFSDQIFKDILTCLLK